MGFAGMHPGGRARAGAVGLGRGTAGRGLGPRVTPRAVYEPRPADCGPPSQELAQIPDFFCFRGSAPVGSQGGGRGELGGGQNGICSFLLVFLTHRWSLFSKSLCRTGGHFFQIVCAALVVAFFRWSGPGGATGATQHSACRTHPLALSTRRPAAKHPALSLARSAPWSRGSAVTA